MLGCYTTVFSLWLWSASAWEDPMRGCCRGVKLRLGLPNFSSLPFFEYHGAPVDQSRMPNSEQAHTGFFPHLLAVLSSSMGLDYEIVTVNPLEMISDPLAPLRDGKYDMTFSEGSSATIMAKVAPEVVMTSSPFVTLRTRALVYKSLRDKDPWALFGPFAGDLWLCVVISIVCFAIVIVALRLLGVDSSQRLKRELRPGNLLRAFYHSLAAVLGGEDYEWTTGSGRVLRLGLLFLVLILVSTYTANLAAFFTRPQVVVYGPTDMAMLKKATACTTYSLGYEFLDPFVGKRMELPHGDYDMSISPVQREQFCLEQLRKRKADVFLDTSVTVTRLALQNNCKNFDIVPAIDFASLHFVGVMLDEAHHRQLAMNMSISMMALGYSPEYQQLLDEYFSFGTACEAAGEVKDTERISLASMYGLFLICGATAVMSLLLGIGERICLGGESRRQRESDSQDMCMTDGELLKETFKKLQSLEERQETKAEADSEVLKLVLAKIQSLEQQCVAVL
eukprot:TRINITY_DN101741_c0_g1_i1.p1 TRINITY_DN101741_c0_g1~~TRINITY_DN101741_c0_g1_i1.p1  ORF type:complete len:507 (-),score=33.98 TRINITY_DN101741_c0_g1_i1:91-1611(-)